MEMTSFWDRASCNLLEADRLLRGVYSLSHQIALMMEAVRTS
jgi:hypothetical protein